MKKSTGKPPRNQQVRTRVLIIMVVTGSLLLNHFFAGAWYASWRSWLVLIAGSLAFGLLGDACATWLERQQQRKRESH